LYDAFGQREIAQYFTQLSSYEVIMEVLPRLQQDVTTLDKIYLRSTTTGGEVPLSAFAKWSTTPIQPLSISHQGQFPRSRSASISGRVFRLARRPRRCNGRKVKWDCRVGDTSFQGNAQAFQASLSSVPC